MALTDPQKPHNNAAFAPSFGVQWGCALVYALVAADPSPQNRSEARLPVFPSSKRMRTRASTVLRLNWSRPFSMIRTCPRLLTWSTANPKCVVFPSALLAAARCRLDAIKAACQQYINGPLPERLRALLQQALNIGKLDATRSRLYADPESAAPSAACRVVTLFLGNLPQFCGHGENRGY